MIRIVKYTIEVDDETWTKFKKRVSKVETLNSAIVKLIERLVEDKERK